MEMHNSVLTLDSFLFDFKPSPCKNRRGISDGLSDDSRMLKGLQALHFIKTGSDTYEYESGYCFVFDESGCNREILTLDVKTQSKWKLKNGNNVLATVECFCQLKEAIEHFSKLVNVKLPNKPIFGKVKKFITQSTVFEDLGNNMKRRSIEFSIPFGETFSVSDIKSAIGFDKIFFFDETYNANRNHEAGVKPAPGMRHIEYRYALCYAY